MARVGSGIGSIRSWLGLDQYIYELCMKFFQTSIFNVFLTTPNLC